MGLFGLIKIKLAEGDTSLALKLTKKLIGLKPKNISFQKTFLELQLMEEDWNGAHKTFLDLQKLEPTDKVARNRDEGTHLYLIAKKLREEGKIEESKFLFQRNIVFNPKDSKSYLYLAKIFKKEENEFEEEKNINATLLLESDNEEAMYRLIDIKLEKSDIKKVEDLKEKFKIICDTLCSKIDSIDERLSNINVENES